MLKKLLGLSLLLTPLESFANTQTVEMTVGEVLTILEADEPGQSFHIYVKDRNNMDDLVKVILMVISGSGYSLISVQNISQSESAVFNFERTSSEDKTKIGKIL